MLKEVRYDWVDVDEISVLDERYYSALSEDEFEALKQVIRERGKEFSLENPIKVNVADGGPPILRDGLNRLKIFRELGYGRIYAIIRVFEKREEAVEDAKWGSIEDNWHRGQRDPRQLVELIRKWTAGMDEGEAAKLLIERGFSRSYAYDLMGVVRDEELSRMVAEGEISLRRAIELARERKSKIVSDVGQIGEKPGKGVISEKEALSELHKPPQTRREEISAKKPRRREISRKGGRPRKERIPGLTARLRDELERAFKALGIEDESTRTMLMCEAAEVLGSYPVEIQSKAVKKWRESGGSMSFQQALEEIRREKEKGRVKEKREERPESCAEELEEVVEEARAEELLEATSQQILLKVVEKPREERIRECAEYFKKYLRSLKIPEEEAAKIAEHEEVKKLYEEVGASPLDFETLLYLTGWKKIMFDVFKLKDKAPSKAGDLSKHVPKLVDALRKNLDTVKRKMEQSELQKIEILGRFGKLLDEEAKVLPNGTLLLYSDLPIRLTKPSNIFLTEDFAKHLRLQEALANLIDNISGYQRITGAEEKLQVAEVTPDVVGMGYHANIVVPLCPSCKRPLTCAVCGAPVNCKCGWPSIKYGKAKEVR